MKSLFESFLIAFSMYSVLPVRNVTWNDKNMRYALIFFPLVGIAEGAALFAVYTLCAFLGTGAFLFSALAVLIMVFVTGGIHLDGFCDTADALFSRREMEKKLQILKDPNCGPFAVFSVILVFLLMAASLGEIYNKGQSGYVLLISAGFVISRILSGISVTSFKCAKTSSLVRLFGQNAGKHVRIILIIELAAVFSVLAFISYKTALMYALLSGFVFLMYYRMQKKEFGGITGDLAGFFLVINETVLAVFTALFGSLTV